MDNKIEEADRIVIKIKPDPKCKKCYGRGYLGIITHEGGKQLDFVKPQLCPRCMVKKGLKVLAEKHPGKQSAMLVIDNS